MRADRRHVISFFQNTKVKNAYGEYNLAYTLFKTTYASAEPLLGNEFLSHLAANSKVEVKFRMMFIQGIKNDMRVLYNNEYYDVISTVNVKGMNRELLVYAGKV